MSQYDPQHPQGPIMMDPSNMGHHHPGHFGAPGSIVTTIYQAVSTPSQSPHTQHHVLSNKRSRPDDFGLSISGMSDLDQADLDVLPQTPMGPPYASAAGAVVGHEQLHTTHHHHHLPDAEPPSKIRRDEGGGGAPSVVGQEGMPLPAPRPRGPKLKFTPEDDQLLVDLKENRNLTWKQIADFFPGRSSGTLQVRYCTKLKAKTTQWTDETDTKLRTALQDYENEKWRIVANKLGPGFTPVACRERAEQLMGDLSLQDLQHPLSPPGVSAAEAEDTIFSQEHHL